MEIEGVDNENEGGKLKEWTKKMKECTNKMKECTHKMKEWTIMSYLLSENDNTYIILPQ